MYGGGHYVVSAAAHLTPQGHAIFEASSKFGDGKTLPVSRSERPCPLPALRREICAVKAGCGFTIDSIR